MNLKEENEELREVLELARSHIVELCTVMNIPLPDATIRRIDSALYQQDGNEVASPAQDEPVGIIQAIDGLEGEDPDEFKEVNVWVDLPVGTKLYATRPAQTALQPELVMPVALGSVNADYDKGWADHAAEVVRLNAALTNKT